jgi:hypothetical protein
MIISETDKKHYQVIRDNVKKFLELLKDKYDNSNITILDIAPQVHNGVKGIFENAKVLTLDIDPSSNADYILDICNNNSSTILDNTFDLIVCTEVLEHTNNPFLAVDELYRMCKVNGTVAASTPFNFRIHGPLPDNWRFTVHGLNVLFSKFKNIEISSLEDDSRFLMPIQYTTLATK